MHSITDIAKDINRDIEIIHINQIIDAQHLEDKINECKYKNRFVMLFVLDNYKNYAHYVEQVRNSYDNFAYSTPGKHNDEKHISCMDFLTRFSCDNNQPLCDHDREKLYDFVFLVGKPHQHRLNLLVSLAEKKLLKNTLLSFQNTANAYSHILPKKESLPMKYEWPTFNDLGGFDHQKHNLSHFETFLEQQGKVLPPLYEDTGCSIVAETNLDKDIVYLTEKTWTPIVAEHILLIHGNYGTTNFLNSVGFDLNYDGIPVYDNNNHQQITAICQDISVKSIKELYHASREKRRFNRNLALNEKYWINYHQQQLKNFGGPFT